MTGRVNVYQVKKFVEAIILIDDDTGDHRPISPREWSILKKAHPQLGSSKLASLFIDVLPEGVRPPKAGERDTGNDDG